MDALEVFGIYRVVTNDQLSFKSNALYDTKLKFGEASWRLTVE